MRVERGRGALVAVAEPEAGAGDAAAQAFERLGAEVTILRRAMENLAAAVVEEAQPVDPTPTLEAMAAPLEARACRQALRLRRTAARLDRPFGPSSGLPCRNSAARRQVCSASLHPTLSGRSDPDFYSENQFQ
jgi:hypothetical protein